MSAAQLSSPRLRALAQRPDPVAPASPGEVCELCGAPVGPEHRHVAEVATRRLVCVCRPCSLLFDRRAAAQGRLRLIPDRPRRVQGLVIDEALWARLDLPVQIAFFMHSSASGRVEAFYPSPLGPTQSTLELGAWSELEAAHPALGEMAQDVEALLVNRTRHRPGHWIAPIDDCYRLVALIRGGWQGFSGGAAIWGDLEAFFERLDHRATVPTERRQ